MGFLNVLHSNYYSVIYIVILSCCIPIIYFSIIDRNVLKGKWFTYTTIALNILVLCAVLVSIFLFFSRPKEVSKKLQVIPSKLFDDEKEEEIGKITDEQSMIKTKQAVEKKSLFETEDEKKGKSEVNTFDVDFFETQEKEFNLQRTAKDTYEDKILKSAIYFAHPKRTR